MGKLAGKVIDVSLNRFIPVFSSLLVVDPSSVSTLVHEFLKRGWEWLFYLHEGIGFQWFLG
jgi:hypothetical protein